MAGIFGSKRTVASCFAMAQLYFREIHHDHRRTPLAGRLARRTPQQCMQIKCLLNADPLRSVCKNGAHTPHTGTRAGGQWTGMWVAGHEM